jgi:hypothetical protein
MRRIVSCGALTALALTLGAGCASERSPGEAALSLTGSARVSVPSGDAVTISNGRTISLGETVRAVTGAAILEFSHNRRIELRPGGILKVDKVPTLTTGDALLVAGATPLVINAAGSTVKLTDGAARVGRHMGLHAGTYAGTTLITSAGRRLTINALRQATVPSLGDVPNRVEPLDVSPTDAWDRLFLGEALELTDQLQAHSEGLTGQLPAGEGRTASFLTSVVPDLGAAAGFAPSLVSAQRPPGETLVGATIAMAGRLGSLADRWQAAFAFRDQGASWGLVALDQGVTNTDGVARMLDAALARAQSFTIQFAAPQLPLVTPPVDPEPGSVVPALPSSPPTTARPPADTTPSAPTSTPPDEPEPGPLDTVSDALDDLVGGLLGGLDNEG